MSSQTLKAHSRAGLAHAYRRSGGGQENEYGGPDVTVEVGLRLIMAYARPDRQNGVQNGLTRTIS